MNFELHAGPIVMSRFGCFGDVFGEEISTVTGSDMLFGPHGMHKVRFRTIAHRKSKRCKVELRMRSWIDFIMIRTILVAFWIEQLAWKLF